MGTLLAPVPKAPKPRGQDLSLPYHLTEGEPRSSGVTVQGSLVLPPSLDWDWLE